MHHTLKIGIGKNLSPDGGIVRCRKRQVREVGGLDKVSEIIVPEHNKLLFALKDGSVVETEWRHRSRHESWTDEMKKKAAEHAKRGGSKNG